MSASSQKAPAQGTVEATRDSDPEDNSSASEADQHHAQASSSKRKNKKRSKVSKALNTLRGNEIPQSVVNHVVEQVKAEQGSHSPAADPEAVRAALEQLKIMDVLKGKAGVAGRGKKAMGEHKRQFWATQPVPQLGEEPPTEDGYIEPTKAIEDVRQEPYPLPKDFEWAILDINDSRQIKEVYDLLSLNYVEDDEAAFRFQYSAEFLEWALKPPGYYKEWHLGVRVSSNKKLVAFISGVPITLRVRGNVFRASEINFLCVHKKLRSKRLAPVLIKEVTRQVNLQGIAQAIYTAGVVLPTPVSTCRYYHRSLNIPKLVDVKFTFVPRNMTLARMIRVYKTDTTPRLPGLREMEEKDISQDPESHRITDFFSFYSLPSTIINHPKHNLLQAAYLYYYASDVVFEPTAEESGKLKRRLNQLIGDALIIADRAKFDVFNAVTLMDNVKFLEDLKFGAGDGLLNFYLYNWRTAPLAGLKAVGDVDAGRGVGVVML
ncbi:hypothetical protein ID866_7435 [Astraeus odoratus]|nr:hypothetical protein ID866_7435 [Astraeus odoratus]